MFKWLSKKFWEMMDKRADWRVAEAVVTRSELSNTGKLWYYAKFIAHDGLEHEAMIANFLTFKIGEKINIRYLGDDEKLELCELLPVDIQKYKNRG